MNRMPMKHECNPSHKMSQSDVFRRYDQLDHEPGDGVMLKLRQLWGFNIPQVNYGFKSSLVSSIVSHRTVTQ